MAKEDDVSPAGRGVSERRHDAKADDEVVKALHALRRWSGGSDAAVITKDDEGKVHVNKDETSTRKGAWGGAGVGAVVGHPLPALAYRHRGGRGGGRRLSAATSGRACPART